VPLHPTRLFGAKSHGEKPVLKIIAWDGEQQPSLTSITTVYEKNSREGEPSMKILIIDDDPDALEVAKIRLAKEGLEILCADGGATGLKIARRDRPDLILLDLDMPDMSGFDVCRNLKADMELCMIPVLFLSGASSPDDKIQGLDLGAVDYITKPFDAFELRARVRAALRTKHLQDMLFEHAHIDPLTGLPNRRALVERLQQEWARIERHGGRLSFIMADLDHFKKINDRYGHEVGDHVLQQVAGAISSQCRETDLPARFGGEEFGIVVPDGNGDTAVHLAERCRREIAKACVAVHDEMVTVTASFGVADVRGASSIEFLLRPADHALYHAKETGRDRVELAKPECMAAEIMPSGASTDGTATITLSQCQSADS
jgi:two-component system, cell cycle response regulator